MDNQIINCRCGRERRNKESNLSGLMYRILILFFILGRPNITNDDILIKVTCNEVVITGSIDKDVTLTVEIKDSSNITIYKEESLTLPHSVNGSLLNPRDEYQLTLVASNKAGDSNPLIYGFDFDVNGKFYKNYTDNSFIFKSTVTDFDIRSATVKYVNNIIKLYLDITVSGTITSLTCD